MFLIFFQEMIVRRRLITASFTLLLASLPAQAQDPDTLRIGFVESIVQESPVSRRQAFSKEFSDLVRDFTGMKSTVTQGINSETAAKQLEDGKWDLGIFHGLEYAWVIGNHPKLKTLMITTTRVSPVKAVLVAKKEGGANSAADLKGKNISLLQVMHCKLFAEKIAGKSRDYFGNISPTRSVEDALDELLGDHVQGAIVDTAALAVYKNLQPGRYDRLKVVTESEPFPPAIIVYREGHLSKAMLERLKTGMMKANQTDRGRESLDAFKVTGFADVPADFQQSLANIVQAYPASDFERK